METESPSRGKVITMTLFTLSVVGLMLFLWLSFGGKVPFNPAGYEIEVAFPYGTNLYTQADVRIAGVNVGKVLQTQIQPGTNRTLGTLQIDNQYAPIHQDATAILRTKTIIGETYVQLTPGTPKSPILPDGGTLANSHVVNAVQLYQIYNTFNPPTRQGFETWQQELAKAVTGNDQNLNSVLGNLPTFAGDATNILQVLDIQHASVVRLLQDGGTVFSALAQNGAALRSLITTGEQTFATTAANNNALADTFHVFPTFLNETKATTARVQSFALDADPVVRELEPVATNLGPTLHDLRVLSPYLLNLFHNLNPLIKVSQTGLPATDSVLRGATPLLASLGPFLEQLNPILNWLGLHQQLTSDFISNGAYALAGKETIEGGAGLTCGGAPCGHYLRQFNPVGPENLAIYSQRDPNNRGNDYPPPLWAVDPANFATNAFPSWDCKNTGAAGDGSLGTVPAPTGAGGTPACRVAPPLPGAPGPYQIPHITAAHYSSK